jgi:hypothetical protein
MGYSQERKETVLKKMLPPNNQSIAGPAKEEGISDATLIMVTFYLFQFLFEIS